MSEITIGQQRIVDTARKIILDEGIESLTTRRLAKILGVTDGALYRHFRSKKEIVSLLVDDIQKTLLSVIKASSEKENDSLRKLEKVFFSHLSYAEQRKGTTFIVINEILNIKDGQLQRKMLAAINLYLKTVEEILVDGKKSGLFKKDMDSTLASIMFFGSVQSLVTLWGLSGYKLSLKKDRLKKMFKIYKSGILNE